ncbi:ECF RNA polymerase sigma factor SigW [compost metagenome]
MLQDAEQAKDVIQDVFTMLWVKRVELELQVSLSSFLYASVRNRTLNQIDHSKVRTKYMDSLQLAIEEGECSTDNLVNEKELTKRIESELANLPEKMRVVFELSRKYDYSYKEIADELSITDHTVKKQMSNALKILRSRINFLFSIF